MKFYPASEATRKLLFFLDIHDDKRYLKTVVAEFPSKTWSTKVPLRAYKCSFLHMSIFYRKIKNLHCQNEKVILKWLFR